MPKVITPLSLQILQLSGVDYIYCTKCKTAKMVITVRYLNHNGILKKYKWPAPSSGKKQTIPAKRLGYLKFETSQWQHDKLWQKSIPEFSLGWVAKQCIDNINAILLCKSLQAKIVLKELQLFSIKTKKPPKDRWCWTAHG